MTEHPSTARRDDQPKKRPTRFKIGISLLVVYVAMWIAAAAVPFMPFDVATKSTIIATDLIAAELIGLLGIALIGKEAYQAMKARLLRNRRRTPRK